MICTNTALPNELIYPCDRTVRSIDLKTTSNKLITQFDFDPRCIQTLGNNVAVGGLHDTRPNRGHSPKGLFAVYNRETNQTLSQELGELINNSISLYTEPGASETSPIKAIICNNDNRLYFADVDNSRIALTGRIKFPAPLNHASISPSKKTIVACGDTQQIYLCPRDGDRPYVANTGTGSTSSGSTIRGVWQTSETLDTWSDYGFSTGFHSSGIVFGVAFQPGVAQLFDMRNLAEPLTQIYSTRPKDWPGAFRCLKFSQGPEDLLFISEQMGRVHMIDLRNFSNHQILMVPPQLSEGIYSTEENIVQEGGKEIIQLYDDMLKSGEAFPLVVNETEVHQMFAEHSNSNAPTITGYDDFPPLDANNLRSNHDNDIAVLEEDAPLRTPLNAPLGSPLGPSRFSRYSVERRASTSIISGDTISELRMDGVSLSARRTSGSSSTGSGIVSLSPPPPAARSNPSTGSSGQSNGLYYRGRRMSATQTYQSLRYLTSPTSLAPSSGSGNNFGGGWSSGAGNRHFDATQHHHPMHPTINTRSPQTEHGVSGIVWTDFEGGGLVVGTENGVGFWPVDQVARRTFPDYEKR